MIVNLNDRRVDTVANGSTNTFVFDFAIAAEDDLAVYFNGVLQTLNVTYTVTGVGAESGGSIVAATNPANGVLVTILGAEAASQPSRYTTVITLPLTRIEDDLSRAIILHQQALEVLSRCLKFGPYPIPGSAVVDTPVVGNLLRHKVGGGIDSASPTAFVPGAVSLPLAFTNGGTNANYASAAALLLGLGAEIKGNITTLTPSAGLITIPNPLTGNYIGVGAGNFSRLSTTGVTVGTIVVLVYENGANVITHGSGGGNTFLIGLQNYTTTTFDRSIFIYDGSSWIELTRIPVFAASTIAKFWRGDGTWQRTAISSFITGLVLANNAGDPTNDIDVAVGATASDDGDPFVKEVMYLSSALTKQLDAAWAVGNNAGGLDTGAVGNNTYHVYLIKRIDTTPAVVDILFSLSATAPTMPPNYTKKQRIGSIIRVAGAILTFVQDGDRFRLTAGSGALDVDTGASGTTAVTVTLANIPTGLRCVALLHLFAGSTNYTLITSLNEPDLVPSDTAWPLAMGGGNASATVGPIEVMVNTSAQVRRRSAINSTVRLATRGWIDYMRGKN